MIYKKRMPESFHMSTTYCAADYLFLLIVTSIKDTVFHTVFKKVSFGQPARQESDKKIVTIHWKTIPYQETRFQGVFIQQHNGIAKVQPCKPIQRSPGAKLRLFVGTS